MNELHKAYAILGLEPGSSMESVLRRYKRLIMVWHPDRAPTPEHKEFAEEELKKINNAKDTLTKHFGAGGGHKATGCHCQPEAAAAAGSGAKGSSSGSSAGPGPRYHRTKSPDEKYQEEQAAKKRDADRKAREEQEAAAKRAQEEQQKKATQQSMQTAMQQQKSLQDEKLRWQISVGLIVAFIGLEIFGSMAMGVKQWWHDTTWKWQNEHSTTDTKPPDVGTDTGTSTNTGTTYIPPYYQTPGGNPTAWQQEQQQRDQEQKDREQKQHDQDVYFTKLEIDKWQKSIDHSTTTIANLEAQIANPSVSDPEKNKLRDYQDYQRKCLADAQVSLKAAQDKLAGLTGESPPQTTPSISSPLTGNPGIPLVPIPNNNNLSPFAPAADPNASPTTGTSTLLSDMMKKYNLDKLTTPSPTTGTDSDSTTTGTTLGGPNSFFSTQKGIDSLNSPSSSTSRFSDLIKKYNLGKTTDSDSSK